MTNNTDPVPAHDELRVQAALLRTPEFMAQFDPEKFARQLERIAADLASAPPSAPVGARRLYAMAFNAITEDGSQEAEEACIRAIEAALAAHATAARDAEIEALRAEVAEWKRVAVAQAELHGDSEARADELAEALREAYGQVRELCDAHAHPYPEASFDRYEAALATAARSAENEKLRAEALRKLEEREQSDEALLRQALEALALLPDDSGMVEHSPEEGPFMFCCGREVTFDRLRGPICTHDKDCWYARMRALRDHDQENRNDSVETDGSE